MSMPYTFLDYDNNIKLNTFRFTQTHSAKVDQVSQAMIYTVKKDIGGIHHSDNSVTYKYERIDCSGCNVSCDVAENTSDTHCGAYVVE